MVTNSREYVRTYRRRKGITPPYYPIHVKRGQNGELRINILEYIRAVTSRSEYAFEGLPEGVTIDDLENQIHGGNFSIN